MVSGFACPLWVLLGAWDITGFSPISPSPFPSLTPSPSLKVPKARNRTRGGSGVLRVSMQAGNLYSRLALRSPSSRKPVQWGVQALGAQNQPSACPRAVGEGFRWPGVGTGTVCPLASWLLLLLSPAFGCLLIPRGRGHPKNPKRAPPSTWAGAEGGSLRVTHGLHLPLASFSPLPNNRLRYDRGEMSWSCFISFYFPGRHLESSGQMTRAEGGNWNETLRGPNGPTAPRANGWGTRMPDR